VHEVGDTVYIVIDVSAENAKLFVANVSVFRNFIANENSN
jgi:hypothetical protein